MLTAPPAPRSRVSSICSVRLWHLKLSPTDVGARPARALQCWPLAPCTERAGRPAASGRPRQA